MPAVVGNSPLKYKGWIECPDMVQMKVLGFRVMHGAQEVNLQFTISGQVRPDFWLPVHGESHLTIHFDLEG